MSQVTISKKLLTAPSVWEKTMKKNPESTTKILPQKKAMSKNIHRVWVERNYDEPSIPDSKSELWWLKWTKGLWQNSPEVFGGQSPMIVGITSPWRQLRSIKSVTWVIYYFILYQWKCPGRNWHSAWRPWLIFDDIQELGKGHKHCRSNSKWANCFTRKIYGIGACWRISRLKSNWADKLCSSY